MMRRKRVIMTWDLTKYYGNAVGLESLYLEVVEGETFGLLGLSGSGRSTAIHLLLGLKVPTRGKAEVLGLDSRNQSYQVRQRVGCVLGPLAFHAQLTGGEFLNLCAGARSINGARRRALVDRFRIDESQRIRAYSRSERQRLSFVQALMHDAPVLLLDDPTVDLDGSSQEAVFHLLEEERSRGKTILVSTDSPSVVTRLCDRAGIVIEGRLRHTQDVHELKRLLGRRIKLTFREDVELEDFITHNMSVVDHNGREWVVAMRGEMGSLVKRLGQFSVEDITYLEGTVEQALSDMFANEVPNPYL